MSVSSAMVNLRNRRPANDIFSPILTQLARLVDDSSDSIGRNSHKS